MNWKLKAFLDGFTSIFNLFGPTKLPKVVNPYEGTSGFDTDTEALRGDWHRAMQKIGPDMARIIIAAPLEDESLKPHVQTILEAVGVPQAYVSEYSAVSDFCPIGESMPAFLARIAKKLGVPVVRHDNCLVKVAEALRDKHGN